MDVSIEQKTLKKGLNFKARGPYIINFSELGMNHIPIVGGKNASLGELIKHLSKSGVRVPGGFATTSHAFFDFLQYNNLTEKIQNQFENLDINNVNELALTGKKVRALIENATFQPELIQNIKLGYAQLEEEKSVQNVSVAVRSSATAEDLPDASFAGQQETYLNISGIDNVLLAVKKVFASLYTDRAISYRVYHGFAHSDVALSVGIQFMIGAAQASSGVMFSIDTESGFREAVFITSAYGLGEMVVQGAVNPDEFYVSKYNLRAKKPAVLRRRLGSKLKKMIYANAKDFEKSLEIIDTDQKLAKQFSLKDHEVEELAQFALAIEEHYKRPMDIEWAKDSTNQKLYILQARPETVRSKSNAQVMQRYEVSHSKKDILIAGRSIGQKVGTGIAKVIRSAADISQVNPGDVLVTDITDPDWEPIMKRAAAIVTNRGGRTCHAAIIAREMGIPAVVGCGNATEKLQTGDEITVSCAEGDTGYIYKGRIKFNIHEINIDKMPDIPTKITMNIANPDLAFTDSMLPNSGVGLARLEFIINTMIGIHPRALLEFDSLEDSFKNQISDRISAYPGPVEFYVQRLAEGISMLACAFKDKPVIVRLSDFKTNEYANLLCGDLYEPKEENPMLGFRGASRYASPSFSECFALECRALKYVRETMGFENVQIMVPFIRTIDEAKDVLKHLKENGLERGQNNLKIIMMCEIPSNALLADKFLEHFDGFSIGSNDLTQLTLGLDRDSNLLSEQFDERDEAVKMLMQQAIMACKKQNKYVGICGQGPSDHPDLAQWLIDQGISSLSLNPDSVLETWLYLAKHSVQSQ